MTFDVFISYSHQDKAVADAACAKLESEGIRAWIAPRDIAPSAEWATSIVEAIDQCNLMVLIFSSSSNQSRQVHREVQQAFDGEKPVVPFRIENVLPQKTLRYYMGSVHWLDALTPPLEQHLQKLATSVLSLLGAPVRALPQLENEQSAAAATVEAKAWSRPEAAREPQRSEGDTRLSGFSYDIYISCAAVDNEPDSQGVSWVSRFARDLDVSLRQRLGRDIRMFFDRTSLRASAAFGDVLETALRRSAIFLPICSPSYFHSEWTVRELQMFLDAAKNRGDEIHVVPVEMLPLDVGALPPPIKSLKRHRLYVADTEGGAPIVLSPVLEPGLYYERLARLAHDLALMLRELPEPAEMR
jgi:hypothetical protein